LRRSERCRRMIGCANKIWQPPVAREGGRFSGAVMPTVLRGADNRLTLG
jgi:hypothetical protein